jgi:rod shape-determining protein MreC
MPLGTLDRTPPPFFKQGPSALSKLIVFSALALFLMVADMRFGVADPLRAVVAAMIAPARWLALQPVRLAEGAGDYFQSLSSAQSEQASTRDKLARLALKANQVEELTQENLRLRQMLELRERFGTTAIAAEILFEAADPYTRKVILNKGLGSQIEPGSPVIDEDGVIGQVTRVHPLVSEVTLITDRDQSIPVLNVRTGGRSVAQGDPISQHPGSLELRYMAANADVQVGDLLTTSGVDGVYPPGLPVATVAHVERRTDSAFARIYIEPKAGVSRGRHVIVLKALGEQLPARPPAEETPQPAPRRGARK